MPGVTVTVPALAGLGPVLAVQVNGPEPVEDNVTLSPRHIVVFEGVILIEAAGAIDTVATACAVHAPVPERTVYVVVVTGVTVTFAALGGFVPELAVQVKGPEPEEVKPTLCPAQIVEKDGVILIDSDGETETVATAEDVHVPVPDITV